MLLDLWNYIRGYVIIEVTGFSVERFVNLAVHKGVYMWDVNYSGPSVRMKVSVKAFKRLKECAIKTKCRFKIIEKKGYPFIAHRYRKRRLFAAGVVIFVFLLYYLSGFVWLVEINGNERIESAVLADYLQNRGLYAGSRKSAITLKAIEKDISIDFTDISFINIGIKGTKATVSVAEILPKEEIIDKSAPCDIIAKKDGIITTVYVSSGDPMVKEKDVVEKGDLLVAGKLLAGAEGDERIVTQLVHSVAEVRAKQYYDMNFTIDRFVTKKEFTQNNKTKFSINILNKELSFANYSNIYANYDKITEKIQLKFGEDYPLPVIISKVTFKEYIPVKSERSLDEMIELAKITINNRIIREFDFNADVIEKIMEYDETQKGLDVKAMVVTNEDIGEISYIQVEQPSVNP